MAFDVEIREVRSWEVKVLLRNEASESDTQDKMVSTDPHFDPNQRQLLQNIIHIGLNASRFSSDDKSNVNILSFSFLQNSLFSQYLILQQQALLLLGKLRRQQQQNKYSLKDFQYALNFLETISKHS